MEDWIKYINDPALVILLSEIIVIMSVFMLVLWIKSSRTKKRALQSLRVLAKDIKQKNEVYKSKISEVLNQGGVKDTAAVEEGMKRLMDSQENLIKDVMVAVRTRDHESVNKLGDSINGMVLDAISIGQTSNESSIEKLEQEKEVLNDKLNDTSSQMNELMTEYKSMFPEEENEKAEAVEEDAGEEDKTLMDISDDLEELDNAISQVSEEQTEEDTQEEAETNLSEDEIDLSDDADDEDEIEEQTASAESSDEEQPDSKEQEEAA